MKLIKIISLMLIFVFFTCSKKTENINQAKVIETKGRVYLLETADSIAKKALVGSIVRPGNTIITMQKSSCVVQLGEHTLFNIKPATIIQAVDLFYKKDMDIENTKLKIERGKLLVKVNKIMKTDESFQIETPTIIAGVRGTVFSVDSSAEKEDVIAVTEGKVKARRKISVLDDPELNKTYSPVITRAVQESIKDEEIVIGAQEQVKIDKESAQEFNEKVTQIAEANSKKIKEIENQIKEMPDKKINDELKQQISQTVSQIKSDTKNNINLQKKSTQLEQPAIQEISADKKSELVEIKSIELIDKKHIDSLDVKSATELIVVRKEIKKEPVQEPIVEKPVQTPIEKTVKVIATPFPVQKKVVPVTPEPTPVIEKGTLNLKIIPSEATASIKAPEQNSVMTIKSGKYTIREGVYLLKIDYKGYKPFQESVIIHQDEITVKEIKLKKIVVISEKITLLDDTVLYGHVIDQNDDVVTIETEDGISKVERAEINLFEVLKKD